MLCALLCCLTAAACSSDVTLTSKKFAASLDETAAKTPDPISPKPESVGRPRVYLDASLSMAGYVSGTPENRTTFDQLLDKFGEYLPGSTVFKFGQGTSQELITPAKSDRSLHTPGFYNLTYNPNDLLIRQLASEEQPPLSIILTDGVQSDFSGQSNPPVVEAIESWMEKGYTFGIVVFVSRFSGPFYSELRRDWIREDGRIARRDAAARPFYAFVFSRTLHEFVELKRKIQNDFSETSAILFSDASIKCVLKAAPKAPRPFNESNPVADKIFWQRFDASIFDKKLKSAELNYEVNCQLDPDYPIKELSFVAETNCYLWRSNKFLESPAPAPADFSCDLQKKEGADSAPGAHLKLRLVKDSRSDHSLYQIKVNGGIGSLRDDLLVLNTDDDSDDDNIERTYKFTSLIMALSELHLKKRLLNRASPTLYLTIANK